jgi:hypothetical protein
MEVLAMPIGFHLIELLFLLACLLGVFVIVGIVFLAIRFFAKKP